MANIAGSMAEHRAWEMVITLYSCIHWPLFKDHHAKSPSLTTGSMPALHAVNIMLQHIWSPLASCLNQI